MDANSLITAFTPQKILIETSVLPLIEVDPTKKTWLGEFLAPKIFVEIGGAIYKIDTSTGSFGISSQDEINAIPNNWGNVIALGAGIVFAVLILRKIFRKSVG